MRSRIATLLGISLVVCLSITTSSSSDRALDEAVRKMLDASTFDINMLDKEASMLVAHGDDHRFYTREEIADVFETAKKVGTKYGVSDFRIVQENSSGQFASVTYRVTWTATVDQTKTVTEILSHEIWEHEKNEWHRVFAAMDATRR